MIVASCHCGAVRLAVATAPVEVNRCTCSICRRYGTLWAYYPLCAVQFAQDNGPSDIYLWGPRTIGFHRCRACGVVTHWAATDGRNRLGINTCLMPSEGLDGVPVLIDGQRQT